MKFEPNKIGEIIQDLLNKAGFQPPQWLMQIISWVILAGILLCALWGLLYILSKIKELVKEFLPPRLSREVRRRLSRRRRFAEHIENEVRRLNSEQAWSDYRFTELEAEVEAEGRRRALPLLPVLLPRTTSGLRRERTLTRAIDVSRERLILIEGEPGSGKSVALRHLTMKLTRRAQRRGLSAVIPLYINLKEIERPQDRKVDRNLIEEFIIQILNRVNDRDVEEFLEEEFRIGLAEGTWLFLFDSFDEIPEVLGSIEPDSVIRSYTRAIEDFLHGMNRCRGVVASRSFRGPGQVRWPRFRILPLSSERREELVHKADLPSVLEREILGRLPLIAERFGDQAKNPLFLSLICEYTKSGRPFPENGHAVFESYIEQRLSRDTGRISRRFGLELATVRRVAEQVAFCMVADTALGLSPSRERIAEAMTRLGFEVSPILPACLDALEFIKLARVESGSGGSERLFTFAHRRFQEYFATCLVLASPDRVNPRNLLLNGQWRETAIVICQTAPREALAPLVEEIRRVFASLVIQKDNYHIDEFPWPPGTLHILSILQDGFSSRLNDLAPDVRGMAGHIVLSATENGTLADRKWALEVCGSIESGALVHLVKLAFASNSRWLAEVAYRQVGRLSEITIEISKDILAELVRVFSRGRFRRERHATLAHLNRLERPERFFPSFRLLCVVPLVDVLLHVGAILYVWRLGIDAWLALLVGFALLLSLDSITILRSIISIADRQIVFFWGIRLFVLSFLCLLVKDLTGCVIFTAVLLWSPAALWAAKEGTFVRIFWWPFLPFLVPIIRIWRIRAWEFLELIIPIAILGGTLASLSVVALPFIKALLAILLILGVFVIVKACKESFIVLRIIMRQQELTGEAFEDNLRSLHYPPLCALYIRRVRERGLLAPSFSTERQIARLALEVELEVKRYYFYPSSSPEVVDELYRLREILRVESPAAPLPPGKLEGIA